MANLVLVSKSFPVPSALLMFPLYNHPIFVPRTMAVEHMPQTLNPYLIAKTQGKSILTKIPVTRVYNDQNMVVLYEDSQRDLYKMAMLLNGYYLAKVTMNVYESQGGRSFKYIDNWANVYTKATREEVMALTWQGIPIINKHMGMNVPLGSGSMPHQPPPMVKIGYVEPPTPIPIHLPLVSKGLVGKMGKSLNMLNIGETLVKP